MAKRYMLFTLSPRRLAPLTRGTATALRVCFNRRRFGSSGGADVEGVAAKRSLGERTAAFIENQHVGPARASVRADSERIAGSGRALHVPPGGEAIAATPRPHMPIKQVAR